MRSMAMRAGALILALSVIGGCGSTHFEATDAAGVRTIRLSGFAEPDYRVQGRLVLNTFSVKPGGAATFAEMMAKAGLRLGDEMKAAIATALRNDGYGTEDGDGGADAVLEVKFGGAPPNSDPMYEDAGGGFKPEYSVSATLKDLKTGKTLFHQFYVYRDNSFAPLDGTILIKPDPRYAFPREDALFADPGRAADGFRAPIPQVAQSLGGLLKKN